MAVFFMSRVCCFALKKPETLTPPARLPAPARSRQGRNNIHLISSQRAQSAYSQRSLVAISLPSRPVQPERCRLRFTPSPSTPAVAFCKPAFTCRFAFVGLLQIALEAPCSSLHPLIHALLAGSPTHLAEYRLAFLDLLFTGSTASTSAPFLHIISASP